jgi:hypothetical protein
LEEIMASRKVVARFVAGLLAIGVSTSAVMAQGRGPQRTTPAPADVTKVEAALPDSAPAKPLKPRKVLAFGHAAGFVHSSIPLGCKTVELLGKKTGAYDTVISFDPAIFTPEKLAEFDAIVLVSTTGDFLDDRNDKAVSEKRRAALLDFVSSGKGVVGIHAACDAFYDWPDYGRMLGGYFSKHGTQKERVAVVNEDPGNPINAAIDAKGFEYADEIYRFLPGVINWGNDKNPEHRQVYQRSALHILLSVDPSKNSNEPGNPDMPVAWIHQVGKGREFYCSLGHNEYVYYDPMVQKYYLAGIQYAIGDLKADDTPKK